MKTDEINSCVWGSMGGHLLLAGICFTFKVLGRILLAHPVGISPFPRLLPSPSQCTVAMVLLAPVDFWGAYGCLMVPPYCLQAAGVRSYSTVGRNNFGTERSDSWKVAAGRQSDQRERKSKMCGRVTDRICGKKK